jgi:hypothetical protein
MNEKYLNVIKEILISFNEQNDSLFLNSLNNVKNCLNIEKDKLRSMNITLKKMSGQLKVKDEKTKGNLVQLIESYFNYEMSRLDKKKIDAFNEYKLAYDALLNLYEGADEYEARFYHNIIKHFMRFLFHTAVSADKQMIANKTKPKFLDESARILIHFFSSHQSSEDKSLVFFCIVCLIKVYFKLNTYRNSNTPVNWVKITGLDLNTLPKSEVVTYLFYSGRLQLYDLKIHEALETFNSAYNQCHKDSITNKRLIIEFMIPLNLFYGVIPSKALLDKYDLNTYYGFIEAFKQGDLNKFEEELNNLEDRLIALGTFLIVEKLKCFVMRNLVKHIYNITFEGKNTIQQVLQIDVIYNVLTNVLSYKLFDKEELELYLIGVLYKGLIRGYVNNTNKVIIFGKENQFPALKDVFNNNYNKII